MWLNRFGVYFLFQVLFEDVRKMCVCVCVLNAQEKAQNIRNVIIDI